MMGGAEWARGDSNSYAFRHQVLSLAWLPLHHSPPRIRLAVAWPEREEVYHRRVAIVKTCERVFASPAGDNGYNRAGERLRGGELHRRCLDSQSVRSLLSFPMAEKAKKIRITNPDNGHDASDVSFEAANAIPVVQDDAEDAAFGREPIDLDADIDLSAAVADANRANRVDVFREPEEAPDQDEDGGTPSPVVSSKELDSLRAQLSQANDERLRALADLQNFRRRSQEERQRLIRDANERLIQELLPVVDDFDLAVSAAEQAESYDQLIGGVKAILRKLNDALAKQGLAPIPAVGEKFDTDVHEAVMLDEDTDQPADTVTAELRRGYTLHGRVIRPSLVKVAK